MLVKKKQKSLEIRRILGELSKKKIEVSFLYVRTYMLPRVKTALSPRPYPYPHPYPVGKKPKNPKKLGGNEKKKRLRLTNATILLSYLVLQYLGVRFLLILLETDKRGALEKIWDQTFLHSEWSQKLEKHDISAPVSSVFEGEMNF